MKRAAKRKNAPKWRVRQRVRKALKKYVRKGNAPARGKYRVHYKDGQTITMDARDAGKRAAAKLEKALRSGQTRGIVRSFEKLNPSRVKGRKVKGGRAVTLKNFTGTVVRKANGQVQIVGKGRKK